jgi:hypothetical protein
MEQAHLVDQSPRCRATNVRGERCGRAPIKGAAVCHQHGGSAPQVKRKAALRLAMLVDPAIATLARIMTDQSVSPGNRLRAANSILDRAGIVRQQDIDLETAQALLVQRLVEMREERQSAAVQEALEPPTLVIEPA